ncbi:carbohydrate ABC transporter permease [Alicyclobacillus ferrooxydans]|uniref:carbohydrate ABC transporter permease n=1 Tax=Alicyclobacillus ferrooxydans TaxID=471514 RepID=UPI0009F839A3|nr:sugar ABC transporter permease [Alicyclobacillus ferrooxydans]
MRTGRGQVPILLLAPFVVLFAVFFIFPVLYALYLSLFVSHGGQNIFVGLQNYVQVFQDTAYWSGLLRVILYGVIQVTIMLIVALVLALLLDSDYVKGKAMFRLIYFLPYAVPGVIAAIMWGFLYAPQLDPLMSLFSAKHPLNLLAQGHVLAGIINMATWEWAGYNMTIYFASLTSIPVELYEAARLDGCSEVQTAIHVKVPMIRQTIILTVVLSIIGSLQLFNEPFVLASLTTISASYTPNMYIYNTAFSYGNFNYSAAMSVVLAVITFVASLFFLYMTSEPAPSNKKKVNRAEHPNMNGVPGEVR